MDFKTIVNQYHQAADEFSRGNPEPVKMMFSHQNDVCLANPFGPAVRGWQKVSEALDFASSRMKEGEVKDFETIAEYFTPQLVTILEIEKWKAKISGRDAISSFDLRVSSTFRYENGTWKMVHRHADPIASFNPDGPIRNTNQ